MLNLEVRSHVVFIVLSCVTSVAFSVALCAASFYSVLAPLSPDRSDDPPPDPPSVPSSPGVLISAVFADGYASRDADEALQIWNVGDHDIDIGGWRIEDGSRAARFPPGVIIAAGAYGWVTRDAAAFARSFGHPPDWAWGDPVLVDDRAVGPMVTDGSGPTLANVGDEVRLVDAAGTSIDVVVYGETASGEPIEGWLGPAVRPFHPGVIGGAHQVVYRTLDQETGRPIADTDRGVDWASSPDVSLHGRRARFPGWDLEEVLSAPWSFEEKARLEVVLAPDGLFRFLDRHIAAATESIDIMVYTFEHPALAERLAARARAGVHVRLLVDGSPAGGHDPTGRWCLNLLAESGADVRFLDDADGIRARYRSQHAKLIVINDRMVLVGTENPTLGSAPVDGTAGRRGAWVATDALGVLEWARLLFDRDFDLVNHTDLRPFQPRDPKRGAPAPDFLPKRGGGGPGYTPRWVDPTIADGPLEIETVSAPETTRRLGLGLLGLVARAGRGDVVRVAQLREPLWWGGGAAEGEIALNPRLVAYLDAARRGARVRVMLDGYFDDSEHPNSNAAAVAWLRERASAESLDLEARTANPTGKGLHAKVILVESDGADEGPGERWIHVGSVNGTEVASLVNREVALNIRSAAAHDALATVFDQDWVRGANPVWLPRLDR